MNQLVKAVRHIQINKIAYTPSLYTAVITYEAHPAEYDESDDIEFQKDLMNKLIKDEWFCIPCEILERSRRLIDKHER